MHVLIDMQHCFKMSSSYSYITPRRDVSDLQSRGGVTVNHIPPGCDATGLSPIGYYGFASYTAAWLLLSLIGNRFWVIVYAATILAS